MQLYVTLCYFCGILWLRSADSYAKSIYHLKRPFALVSVPGGVSASNCAGLSSPWSTAAFVVFFNTIQHEVGGWVAFATVDRKSPAIGSKLTQTVGISLHAEAR